MHLRIGEYLTSRSQLFASIISTPKLLGEIADS